MPMLKKDEFSMPERAVIKIGMQGANLLSAKADTHSRALSEAGLNETAELIARLADRLMRQEQLLLAERNRSAALELQLASKQPILVA